MRLQQRNKKHLVLVVEDQRFEFVVSFGGLSDQLLEVRPPLGPPSDVLQDLIRDVVERLVPVHFFTAADTVERLLCVVRADLILADEDYDVVLARTHDLAALLPVVHAVCHRRLRVLLHLDFILFKINNYYNYLP